MALVFANCTTWISATTQLVQDEAWHEDDPVVKSRPDMFNPEPTIVRGARKVEVPVETATAEPGEKRSTRARRGEA